MPPLPETLYFDAGKRVDSDEVFVTFGLVDDPDHQSQMTHKLNITAMNYMLIGSTQTGKTNFLQTAIRSLTEHYSPDEVNIYIVDFASMILKNFENLNHVGGVVLSHEDEKVKNLFRLLSNEIDLRKSRFAEVGVSSFASYKEAGYRDLPQIVVVIDNLTALKELYLQDNDMLLPVCRDGNSVGISFWLLMVKRQVLDIVILIILRGELLYFVMSHQNILCYLKVIVLNYQMCLGGRWCK